MEGRALAADRLGDQEALAPGEPAHGGGVELEQLEVRQRRAGGVGEQQAEPLGAGWVGGARPQRRGAARAEHDRARRDDAAVVADQAATAVVAIGPQRPRPRALEDGDRALRGDERGELAHHAPAGRGAAGVDDAPDRVPALEAEREAPGAVAVEVDAERLQVLHPRGRLAHEDLGRRAPDERAPGALGVGEVQLEAVVGGERRGEAALRPVGGRLGQRRGGDQDDVRALARRAERRVEPGGAGAHHHDLGLAHRTGLGGAHFFGGSASNRGFEAGGASLDLVGAGGVAFGAVFAGAVVGVERPGVVALLDGLEAPVLEVVLGVLGVVAGRLVLGVLAPGTAGVVVVGTVAVGTVAVGVTAGLVTVIVVGTVVECPEPPASLTSAAASTPSASATITASAITGVFQEGDAASRVRAAAPQCRHHSCSGASAAPHSGHAWSAGGGAAVGTGAEGGAATLTRRSRGDGRSRWAGPGRWGSPRASPGWARGPRASAARGRIDRSW